ncbi:methylenetetrahydrofolate reductase (NAD(P)H) met13 [Cystobasidiomycetes sp. EMM_F5]
MRELGPTFIDITWGAGGTRADTTAQFVKAAHEEFGLETCMHLTCTDMARDKIEKALEDAYESGCHNILALRGDPPKGQTQWVAPENGFRHAIDLVKFIREKYGGHFDIAIAGFPEGHPDRETKEIELRHLKAKVDAGATFIFTQMFYDFDIFAEWVRDVRAAGIDIPIIPGIMPIQNYAGFKKTTKWFGTIVPDSWEEALASVQDDDDKVRQIGTQLVAQLCRQILGGNLGIHGLHFYTMNLEKGTKLILSELGFVADRDIVSPLPWRPSLTNKRRGETIRPIFWANRAKSYLARTEAWDEFPNGRWGDSRSPAYGEMRPGIGLGTKQKPEEVKQMLGSPTTLEEVGAIFADFCRGKVAMLPWSEGPAAKETSFISTQLAEINENGYLTINSQPAVDGVKSSHPVHGWGPRNGYIYQKAYLEFFCSAERADKLLAAFDEDPDITYYAVTKAGQLRTNCTEDAINAVTWGIFPAKEVLQPTIVEQASFEAWKDEAFELGQQWANLYPTDSPSNKILTELFDSYYLINIVHNDFRHPDPHAIFKPFLRKPNQSKPWTNGFSNGH